MDIHTLLQDIAACEVLARSLRDKLSGSTDLGLNFDNVDYRDTATIESYLAQGKALLRPLKEFGKVLQSLTQHTEYAIDKIENKIQPLVLHDGINSLPDEVLAMIFDSAISSGDDENEEYDARSLTSVNHKFRNAALGSHRLWSTLSHGNGKKAFKLFLDRSGDAPLTIDLGINPPKWYMDEVLALGHRWGKVVVHQNMLGFMSQVREYGKRECAHQSYPRLKALEIFLSNGLHREDFDFTWHIPAIKSLICMNVIPTLSDESFASLTTLELTMDDGYVLYEILPQLQLMQNLQFLSLVIGDVDKSWRDLDDYSDCDLKSLQSLHLAWSHVSVEDLAVFLDKINMENVKKVELNFLESFGDEISPEINCVFDSCDEPHIRFPSLEDTCITIVAVHLENLDGLALEAGLLFDYPKIKNLHIQLPFIEPLDSHLLKNHQLDIKTIAIEGCLIGAYEFLECLLSHVNPDGSRLCSGLAKLRVWGCAEVSRNFLMDYLPEEKIDFLPYEVPYFF